MNQYEEDVEDVEDVEDDDDEEEDVEQTKARRKIRLDRKKTQSNRREIIPRRFREEKVKRKAYRPKIEWNGHSDYDEDDYLDY